MNCQRLQESLYDYLDDSLSPFEKVAARRHLAECPLCREELRREQQLAQAICTRLEQVVKPVMLNEFSQRGLVASLEGKSAESCQRPLVSFWSRRALPFAVASVILIATLWMGYHFIARQDSHLKTAQISPRRGYGNILVHVSYCVPSYIFQKQGNQIIDALTYDERFADGLLLVKN